MKKQGKLRRLLPQLIGILSGILLGFVLGLMMARLDLAYLPTMLIMVASIYLQIIVHEGGHLLFGLLTGYGFLSFRIGSLMLVREEGRLRLRRHRVAGTGGQCLLIPPEGDPEHAPYLLYHLGGSLLNLLFALFCLPLMQLGGYWTLFALCGSLFGLILALSNGVPMHLSMLDNDGMNALQLRRAPALRVAVCRQLQMNAALSRGMRLRDMPDEWFDCPAGCEGKHGIFRALRLMDEGRYADARALIRRLASCESMVGIHRAMLANDEYCLALLAGEAPAPDAKTQKLRRTQRASPSFYRTEYVAALLRDDDPDAAEKALAQFEKRAKRAPYPCDLLADRDMIALAKNIYDNQQGGTNNE